MNAIRCPQCSLVNPTSAIGCEQCQFPFSNVPKSAYVSVAATEYEQSARFNAPPMGGEMRSSIDPNNSTDSTTHLFYRIYCGFMAFMYLCLVVMGFFMASMVRSMPDLAKSQDAAMLKLLGPIYAIIGLVLLIPFALGIFFPRKPWNWIYGIIMIAFGMTSICFIPFLIPLLIFWVKPETQVYFGRK